MNGWRMGQSWMLKLAVLLFQSANLLAAWYVATGQKAPLWSLSIPLGMFVLVAVWCVLYAIGLIPWATRIPRRVSTGLSGEWDYKLRLMSGTQDSDASYYHTDGVCTISVTRQRIQFSGTRKHLKIERGEKNKRGLEVDKPTNITWKSQYAVYLRDEETLLCVPQIYIDDPDDFGQGRRRGFLELDLRTLSRGRIEGPCAMLATQVKLHGEMIFTKRGVIVAAAQP